LIKAKGSSLRYPPAHDMSKNRHPYQDKICLIGKKYN